MKFCVQTSVQRYCRRTLLQSVPAFKCILGELHDSIACIPLQISCKLTPLRGLLCKTIICSYLFFSQKFVAQCRLSKQMQEVLCKKGIYHYLLQQKPLFTNEITDNCRFCNVIHPRTTVRTYQMNVVKIAIQQKYVPVQQLQFVWK